MVLPINFSIFSLFYEKIFLAAEKVADPAQVTTDAPMETDNASAPAQVSLVI